LENWERAYPERVELVEGKLERLERLMGYKMRKILRDNKNNLNLFRI
jgi:hypothetical protein